jgi:DNA-binding transcriptional MerR regulator
MAQTEAVYSAKQVAQALGISSGMLRRYALAFEEITGEIIKQHPRDGRQYDADQLATLQRARAFVTANSGMSVDMGLRLAMGAAEQDVMTQPSINPQASPEALVEAFRRSQEPLLEKLSSIEAELQALRAEGQSQLKRPSKEKEWEDALISSEPYDSALVKMVRRLERLLGRGR